MEKKDDVLVAEFKEMEKKLYDKIFVSAVTKIFEGNCLSRSSLERYAVFAITNYLKSNNRYEYTTYDLDAVAITIVDDVINDLYAACEEKYKKIQAARKNPVT